MKNYKIIIFFLCLGLLISCSPSKETSKSKPTAKSSGKELSDLPEEEQIKFSFLFHNASKERILGNFQAAATLFVQCSQIAPNEPSPYYELANLFEGSNEAKLALEYSEKAVKLDPKNYWYRVLYAQSLQKAGNFDAAIKEYQKLIEQHPDNVDLYFDLAGMQLYSGKYKESIASFNVIEQRMGISEEI